MPHNFSPLKSTVGSFPRSTPDCTTTCFAMGCLVIHVWGFPGETLGAFSALPSAVQYKAEVHNLLPSIKLMRPCT